MATLTCPSTDLNFLSPNGFLLNIERLPKVNFFAQTVNIPSITLPPLEQDTPLSLMKFPSDKLVFGEFNVTFNIDEQMNNWFEVFKWMRGLGFPEQYEQYTTENNRGLPGISEQMRNYSDATLIVLGANNVPVRTFTFKDCFPTALSGIEFSSKNTDVQYVTATVDLEYSYFTAA